MIELLSCWVISLLCCVIYHVNSKEMIIVWLLVIFASSICRAELSESSVRLKHNVILFGCGGWLYEIVVGWVQMLQVW